MTISDETAADLSNPEGEKIFVNLIEISHPAMPSTFRLADTLDDFTSGGLVYVHWDFTLPILSEIRGDLPKPALRFDNTETDITSAIKQYCSSSRIRPTVIHKLVMFDLPDVIERGPTTYKMRKLRVKFDEATAYLTPFSIDIDAIPFKKIDPTNTPGAFGVIR